jgi:hypothetical protein
MDKQLGCALFSVGIPVDLNFKHGRLELVITHIGRLSLSLFSMKEPAAMGHVHGFTVLKKSKLRGYNKIKESSNTGNLHLH